MKKIVIGLTIASCFSASHAATLFEANFNTNGNELVLGGNYAPFAPPSGFSFFDSKAGLSEDVTGMSGAGLARDNPNSSDVWVQANAGSSGGFSINNPLSFVAGQSYTIEFDYRGVAGYDVNQNNDVFAPLANNWVRGFQMTYTHSGNVSASNVIFYLGAQNIMIDSSIDNIKIYDQVSAVPEPGEWAMMLAGLGVVSAIARKRKNKAV